MSVRFHINLNTIHSLKEELDCMLYVILYCQLLLKCFLSNNDMNKQSSEKSIFIYIYEKSSMFNAYNDDVRVWNSARNFPEGH